MSDKSNKELGKAELARKEAATAALAQEIAQAQDAERAETTRFNAGRDLIWAAQVGDFERVKALLPVADLGVKSREGLNALQEAIWQQNGRCVEMLLPWFDAKAKDPSGHTALMNAAATGWSEGVEMLLPASEAKAAESHGWTALMMAAMAERDRGADCLLVLLPESDARATDNDGMSALMHAANSRNAKRVEALLPASDPLAVDRRYGMSALMMAASGLGEGGVEAIVDALIPFSDLRARDNAGLTALDHAKTHHQEIFPAIARGAEKIRQAMLRAEQEALAAEVEKGAENVGTTADGQSGVGTPRRRAPKTL